MDAISYARVSSRNQEDNASLESQLAANRDWANSNGFNIVREVREVFSGFYLFDRPALNEIRNEIRQGKYKALIIYDVDRLTRNMSHLGVLVTECERFNTRLVFASGDFENSPDGRLLLSIKSYLAEAERVKIIERTTRGRKAKAESGTLSFKRKLFGYYLDEEGKRHIFEPEAEIVRHIFSSFLDDKSLREIATKLNDRGITTPRGKTWYAHSVNFILKNPSYSGRTYVFRERKVSKYIEGERKTQTVYNESEAWIELDGVTPAIVPEEDFNAVQIKLEFNRTQKRGRPKYDFLLRGFVRCRCGKLFSPHKVNGTRRYICTSTQLKATNCKTSGLNANKAETAVWDTIFKILKSEKELTEYIEKRSASKEVKNNNSEKIARLEKEVSRLVTRMATVDDRIWATVQKDIENRQFEIEKLKAQKQATKPRFDGKAFRKVLRETEMDFEGKVKILKMFQFSATFDGEKLKIDLGV